MFSSLFKLWVNSMCWRGLYIERTHIVIFFLSYSCSSAISREKMALPLVSRISPLGGVHSWSSWQEINNWRSKLVEWRHSQDKEYQRWFPQCIFNTFLDLFYVWASILGSSLEDLKSYIKISKIGMFWSLT